MSKKKNSPRQRLKMSEEIRRLGEIKEYGKILSLRPSLEYKMKKLYTRKRKHKNEDQE